MIYEENNKSGNTNVSETGMICKQKFCFMKMICSALIPLLVGGFSAFLTADDMKLYDTMSKPALAPPWWLFPIVWTILYIMMGIAAYLVAASDADEKRKRKSLTLYVVQLAMNFFWATLFFTYSRYLLALIWLLAMWVILIICTVRFFKINRPAGIMMCVLTLWTTFAAYLNLATYLMAIR